MAGNPYPLEQAPLPEKDASLLSLLEVDSAIMDHIALLGEERDTSFGERAVGRELSLAITHLEDAQSRLRKAIEARDAQKSQGVK